MPATEHPTTKTPGLRLSPFEYSDYREYLRAYVDGKRLENRAWTYGVWARQLELKSSSLLPMIINGQRHPGPKLVSRMVSSLNLLGDEGQYFQDLVRLQKVENNVRQRLQAVTEFRERHPGADLKQLDLKKFAVISNWYGYAIREMVNLSDFREDYHWISQRLGHAVSPPIVSRVIRDLVDVGLLQRDRLGSLKIADGIVRTKDDQTSTALQSYHGQILDRAKQALSTVDVMDREISGGCFSFSRSQMQTAKELIRRFQHDLCRICDSNEADEVFQIEVAFFPLTKQKPAKSSQRQI